MNTQSEATYKACNKQSLPSFREVVKDQVSFDNAGQISYLRFGKVEPISQGETK